MKLYTIVSVLFTYLVRFVLSKDLSSRISDNSNRTIFKPQNWWVAVNIKFTSVNSHIFDINNETNQVSQNFTFNLKNTSKPDHYDYTCEKYSINWWNITKGSVFLVNGSQLDNYFYQPNAKLTHQEKLDKLSPVPCTVLILYAQWCRYSMQAAPAFNALARYFPQLKFIAVNVDAYWPSKWNLHMFYIPKIKIHVYRRIVKEFNGTDSNLEELIDFVSRITKTLPLRLPVSISDADRIGPVPCTLVESLDYWLWVAWFTLIVSVLTFLLRSGVGQRLKERVYLLWQEHQYMA